MMVWLDTIASLGPIKMISFILACSSLVWSIWLPPLLLWFTYPTIKKISKKISIPSYIIILIIIIGLFSLGWILDLDGAKVYAFIATFFFYIAISWWIVFPLLLIMYFLFKRILK